MSFTITPISTAAADRIRQEVVDGTRAAERSVLTEPGAPCRQCLQPGAIGDEMLLVTYQPFTGTSPYAVPSPVFLHAAPCPTYRDVGSMPPVVRPGLRAVRSYDAGHRLLDGQVVSGAEIEQAVEVLLAEPAAAYLHVHSAEAGCFTCRVDRP